MRLLKNMMDRMRPLYQPGGKLRVLWPLFQAADNFFFSHIEETAHAPHGRDPLDVKRYMSLVIVALMPAFLASLYFFGPRVILIFAVSYAAGGIVEVLFAIVRKEDINEGFLVTGFIFPMIVPPGVPLWMVAVGVVFGVLVGKEVFGGTGRNPFNAALVGRCFLAFGYPSHMTATWLPPGPEKWLQFPTCLSAVSPDAVTTATPLGLAKSGTATSALDLLLGNVAGSVGETSSLAILLGAVFLVAVGVANWRTIAGGMAGLVLCAGILHAAVPARVAPVVFQVLAGGWMFGIVFMATDPVTGPVTLSGKWVYGILIGVLTVLIRSFSGFVEGAMFAILFANICAPLIDEVVIRIYMHRLTREKVVQ